MNFESLSLPPPARRVFCNRTLNMRGIAAIGFDMDYTLVHYKVHEWERRAYEHLKQRLLASGLPVESLEFDPEFSILGLVIDIELGNVVKANRFGYVKRACHGTRFLAYDEQRAVYERVIVDLSEKRWVFVNTLFGLSESCMYMQMVDLLDRGELSFGDVPLSYAKLYDLVRSSLDAAHMEGQLKADIVADPDRYVEIDPELPLALADLRAAGKKLVLITNSEWSYTQSMMNYVFGTEWGAFFDLIVVGARKPAFFTERMPAFEIVSDEGHLLPVNGTLQLGKRYLGGHAKLVESSLGIPGDSLLYVGDHIFSDVNVSKSVNRWRTCLVLRDLENEIEAEEVFKATQERLEAMMDEKELLEHRYSWMRLAIQRLEQGYGPREETWNLAELRKQMREIRAQVVALDDRIAPLAREASHLSHPQWGLLLRTGNDKSHLARQIERHADIYTSRVSNFLHMTPFVYLRSPRGSLPHDL